MTKSYDPNAIETMVTENRSVTYIREWIFREPEKDHARYMCDLFRFVNV